MTPLDPVYALAALVTAPIWARKARGDWPARFGRTDPIPASTPPSPTPRPRLLLHAVSVGEVNALRSLVPLLTPHVDLVVSVGTDTGIARARELFASDKPPDSDPAMRAHVVRYPLDFSPAVRRFLDAVRPDAVGLVELELWPNFIRACRRREIPVAVINGRLSERSFRGYRRLRPFLRSTFASLAFAAVQDETYAQRFRAMGVPPERCRVTGSMKWDSAQIADHVSGADDLATSLGIERTRPLVVVGSTGPCDGGGEESLLHAACAAAGSDVQLLCAPRKPERFDEAFAALGGEGRCVRRSRSCDGPASNTGAARFLLDTIGELRAAYALADVVVIGRSFGDLYGSDPVEPIALGKPVVIGPRHADFAAMVEAFDRAEGIIRTTRQNLAHVLRELLANPQRRRDLADRGRACIREMQGATHRHAAALLGLLPAHRSGS